MNRALLMLMVVGLVACGGGGDGDYCMPQGRITIGAAGTVGAPLDSFADCYNGGMPVVSLDRARGAMVTGDTIVFDDAEITGQIDPETCRVSITYTFDSMLSDNTPTEGTSQFAANPDDGASRSWSTDAEGSVDFEWLDDMNDTTVCGNTLTGVVIAVE